LVLPHSCINTNLAEALSVYRNPLFTGAGTWLFAKKWTRHGGIFSAIAPTIITLRARFRNGTILLSHPWELTRKLPRRSSKNNGSRRGLFIYTWDFKIVWRYFDVLLIGLGGTLKLTSV